MGEGEDIYFLAASSLWFVLAISKLWPASPPSRCNREKTSNRVDKVPVSLIVSHFPSFKIGKGRDLLVGI